jgi:hypothetical protein
MRWALETAWDWRARKTAPPPILAGKEPDQEPRDKQDAKENSIALEAASKSISRGPKQALLENAFTVSQ